MHIGPKGVVQRSVTADFSGYRYAAFRDGPGMVLASKAGTTWLQGDDADELEEALNRRCETAWETWVRTAAGNPAQDTGDDAKAHIECCAIDRVLSEYDGQLTDEPDCGPSSDLMLLYYYSPERI